MLTAPSGGRRFNEPVTVGLPFRKGLCHDVRTLALLSSRGKPIPLQVHPLDAWSDGSIRWALLDFQATREEGDACVYRLVDGVDAGAPSARVQIDLKESDATVDVGSVQFAVDSRGTLRIRNTSSFPQRHDSQPTAGFRITDADGNEWVIRQGQVTCEENGPLRGVLLLTAGVSDGHSRSLVLLLRYHFYAGHPIVRCQATVRNAARAVHPGGVWELGDAASAHIGDFSFIVSMPNADAGARVVCSPESNRPAREHGVPLKLYQDSSGGAHWNSPNHLNRDRIVPLQFRGYQLHVEGGNVTGQRATPVAQFRHAVLSVAVAHRQFWERFPKAIEITDRALRLGLLPGEFGDVHELQGGEQITEDFVLSFGEDGISDLVLDWVRAPLRVIADPQWYCASAAMSYLLPASEDPNRKYLELVDTAIVGDDAFVAKRERIDEYGWRNFGDLYADHEAVKHLGTELFISHYNNQYDAAAGLAAHFFRTGNLTSLTLFEDLARHVIDIDIYHTSTDKAAYNHGLFWHTAHHVNAGIATHRTYPHDSGASGGPSAEHNYNTGLMLFYFLTGDARGRDAAVDLARWVIDMDDGRKTPLRWVSRGRTGLASATGSFTYHGPGRGPGNGIVALLNAYRLTNDRTYMTKADELIRRCVHPSQDIDALTLLDAERRWFYTVFLQALGRYLDAKAERGEFDDMYVYAQTTLVHYARWMAEHEYPYLEKPEILEYPNETWAAQDLRKSEILNYAAKHVSEPEVTRFRERARFFFESSISTLLAMPTHRFTRPLVLALTNGYSHGYFQVRPVSRVASAPGGVTFGRHRRFVPQRHVAVRRLAVAAAGAVAAALGIAGALLL